MAEYSGVSTTASDSKAKAGRSDDWQAARPSIRERCAFMFNNSLMSDVTFVIKDSEAKLREVLVPAHKYVLAISSPVFFAMFYGEIAEKNDSIDLPDCHANGFLAFLRYLYSDEIKLTSGTVLEVLYLSKKYIVPSLSAKCLCFLEKELNIENVFVILTQALRFDEKSLVERCWEFIDTNATDCVNSKEMLQIDRSCLVSLLKRDSLEIKELQLFKAVQKWAEAKCRMNEVQPSGPEMRKVLGDAMYLLRFTTMSPEEFTEHVTPSQILLEKELVLIFSAFHSASSKEQLKMFPKSSRVHPAANLLSLPINRCSRFSHTGGGGKATSRYEELKFKFMAADAKILLCGARLYAGADESVSYNAHVELFDERSLKALESVTGTFNTQKSTMSESKVSGYGFDVMFKEGSVLKPGLTYSLKVTITALSGATVRYNAHSSLRSSGFVNGTQWTFIGESPSSILELLFKGPT